MQIGNGMSLDTLLSSERRLPAAMALILLPWIAVVLFTAGGWVALNFASYAILVLAVGYGIIALALPPLARSKGIVLAPAAGILAISALTAFWLRLGLPLVWVPALWLGLMAAGALCLWTDRSRWQKSTIAYGGALVLFSALICAVYFLPGARNDAVLKRDGSYNWIYVDTQNFHSMAADIKTDVSPPRTPGAATAELLYHFGAYAPAAVISLTARVGLGDALVRVTRGASVWALLLSCFGLGTRLSFRATGKGFGGIMTVAGLFFYGSLLSLFADESNSASQVTGAILYKIPDVGVLANGGPFSHLILGISMLHGLGAITAIMGLCLMQREQAGGPAWRALVLMALPALIAGVNSVAGLYSVGVTCILLFWERLRAPRSWLLILLLAGMFLAAWHTMGYGHAPDAAGASIHLPMAWQWWTILIWFTAGLGFRILAFRWISRQPLKDPLSVLVLATFLGMLAFFILLQLELGTERYGIYYLQSMFSIFAFSRLASGCWRRDDRCLWVSEWLAVAKLGLLLLVSCAVLVRVLFLVTHRRGWIAPHGQIILAFLLLLFLAGASALMKRSRRFSAVSSGILMGVLLMGFLAWITPWLNFGMGRMKLDVTLSPGEVRGLNRLGRLAAPSELFATNKHSIAGAQGLRERSYAYSALSERRVLLEGYEYRGVRSLPWFHNLLHDNDLLFNTADPQTLHDLAKTWHVRWLVARPGTDIALSRPLPGWLVEEPDCGDLRIYRVD